MQLPFYVVFLEFINFNFFFYTNSDVRRHIFDRGSPLWLFTRSLGGDPARSVIKFNGKEPKTRRKFECEDVSHRWLRLHRWSSSSPVPQDVNFGATHSWFSRSRNACGKGAHNSVPRASSHCSPRPRPGRLPEIVSFLSFEEETSETNVINCCKTLFYAFSATSNEERSAWLGKKPKSHSPFTFPSLSESQ